MKIAVPMNPDEVITIREAAYRAHVCTKTIRRWVKSDGIGRQSCPGAPLHISVVALEMRMTGDAKAIDLLRLNQRSHPMVRIYLDRLGLKP